jgi:hypothetical protein
MARLPQTIRVALAPPPAKPIIPPAQEPTTSAVKTVANEPNGGGQECPRHTTLWI